MAAQALIDCELVAGPLRLGGVSNETKLELEAEALDATVFTTGGWRAMIMGERKAMVESQGFMDSSPFETGALAPDAELWNQLGAGQVPVTVSAAAADQSTAYILGGRRGHISLFGKVGDLAPYTSTMVGDGPTARGALLHPATVTRTTSGSGVAFTLGTVPAGRSVYIALHILTVAGGGTGQLTVQSDDNAGFASPTAVANLGPVSVPTASLVVIPGPVTDDRYRVTWSPTGATIRFIAAVGTT